MSRIYHRLLFGLVAVALVATLAGCGGGGEPAAEPLPTVLTVEEAAAAGAAAGTVRVEGFLVAPEGEPARLCSALAESFPPQCGGASLVLEGLELAALPGLTSTDELAPGEPLAQVVWSDQLVELAGVLADGVLRLGRD